MQTPNYSKPERSGFKFDNSYAKLVSKLYQKQRPETVKNPRLLLLNHALARTLGLNPEILEKEGAGYLSGNSVYASSEPIAQAYAGHQFGGFNILGDGRAILLGEHITPKNERFDIQLKGSGRTAYSRSGDGRAALAPMLREYIISEAMHALGIPTTRSLAVVTTGEVVYRDDAYPGAILTRVASSHIRIGTFQYASALQDQQILTNLADYTINRHFPEINTTANKYAQFLEKVIDLQASLISKWMLIGFIHGVMNTDNISISGETIDYGPCAFMNSYDPATVFSSIDQSGRYAYGNQAPIAHWNLYRLAESLLPLINVDEDQSIVVAKELLEAFPAKFMAYWLAGMRQKLGLFNQEAEDLKLAEDLLMYMQKNNADYTNTFRSLGKKSLQKMQIYHDAGFKNWLQTWEARRSRQQEALAQSITLMDKTNPAVIPRNHLVEEALSAAEDHQSLQPLEQLLSAIGSPYSSTEEHSKYAQAPEPQFDSHYKTFCGT